MSDKPNGMASQRDHPFYLVEHFEDIHRYLNSNNRDSYAYLLRLKSESTDVIKRIDLILQRDYYHELQVRKLFDKQ